MREMNEIVSFNNAVLHNDITTMLRELSFMPNYSGFNYIREAVKMVVAMGDDVMCVSKSIYPVIAKRSGTTITSVEHSIRTAITRAWKLTDDSCKLEIFGTYALREGWTPTNSELIYVLADRLRCKAMLENG